MIMLGGVPISVIMPPRIDANDSGISVERTLRPAFLAACMSIGISSASAATLFIIADRIADTPDITLICKISDRPAPIIWRAISSIAPELNRPRLTINTSAMITVAWWPKPENASSCGTTPITIAMMSAPKATRS